jgi:hypothetical protein
LSVCVCVCVCVRARARANMYAACIVVWPEIAIERG